MDKKQFLSWQAEVRAELTRQAQQQPEMALGMGLDNQGAQPTTAIKVEPEHEQEPNWGIDLGW
jgi:hypothetical protein